MFFRIAFGGILIDDPPRVGGGLNKTTYPHELQDLGRALNLQIRDADPPPWP